MRQQQELTKRSHHQSSKQQDVRSMILRNRLEIVIATTTIVAVILVLGSLLVLSRRQIDPAENLRDSKHTNNLWYGRPSLGFEPSSSNTPMPTEQTMATPINLPQQLQPTSPTPTVPTLYSRLSRVMDMSKLEDRRTSLGRAYRWMTEQDAMRSTSNYSSSVQRFVLAAFYFATGGSRTSATWKMCSAVPIDRDVERGTCPTRCVIDTEVNDLTMVCACTASFRECKEYEERNDMSNPNVAKRRWLSDVSECDWYGITCNQEGKVEAISLSQNRLVGTLLGELDLLSELKVLNLAGNTLSRTLPDWVGLGNVQHVDLFGMKLQGSIPSSWQSWSQLEVLNLGSNALSGSLVLPGKWMRLSMLNVTENKLEIGISSELSRLKNLTGLSLGGNIIGTTVPKVIGNLASLQWLDLSDCGIHGSIPDDIGNLLNLVHLDLQQNTLTGTIPDILWSLGKLKELQLGYNKLSGSLSSNVGNLQGLEHFSVTRSGLTAEIPLSLGDLVNLKELQLQQNDFGGKFPDQICDLPNLVDMRADCDGPESLECPCCTVCCNKKRGTCSNPK